METALRAFMVSPGSVGSGRQYVNNRLGQAQFEIKKCNGQCQGSTKMYADLVSNAKLNVTSQD